MSFTKTDIAIVNRSFWPGNQILGEALLRLSERLAETSSVCVITQSGVDLKAELEKAGRGKSVQVHVCGALTDSSSGLVKRALEALYFMLWVFWSLLVARPRKVYVATDPPVFVPFIVFIYAKLFRAEYIYHLQDIHPEAANIVVPLNKWVFRILRGLDNIAMRNAYALITLSEDMKQFIEQRSGTKVPLYLLDNPSFHVSLAEGSEKTSGVVFCGNAGRLQRIPMLLAAIQSYSDAGGKLNFTFIGGGIYSSEIKKLAEQLAGVTYLGYLAAPEASKVVSNHTWALLPIDDEVTRYAFPSKSSSYVLSGCKILAVCGLSTSVARWVDTHSVGISCEPDLEKLVACFFRIEVDENLGFAVSKSLLDNLEIDSFVGRLSLLLKLHDL
tara:strand:+ start:139 stop:1296 length:1158 start_codon:yes stop_codon:yes gene_type:complete